jgi:hypothetical protein
MHSPLKFFFKVMYSLLETIHQRHLVSKIRITNVNREKYIKKESVMDILIS